MAHVEIILFWAAVFTYVSAFCVYLFAFVAGKKRAVACAFWILWAALAFHTAAGIVRWIAGGHPPVTDTYELNLTGTWFTVLIFLVFKKMRKIDSSIALIVIPIVFLLLGYGFTTRSDATPMNPAYNSPWLVVHVVFAWLAFGCFAIATGAAILLLLNNKLRSGERAVKIPDPESLDLVSYRFIVLGFINHAVMLLSGAIWARLLWGRYWSWDPLEIWSLLTFLFYAFYLHARAFLGWKGKRAACLALLGILIMAISYWGVDWFSPSVHPGP